MNGTLNDLMVEVVKEDFVTNQANANYNPDIEVKASYSSAIAALQSKNYKMAMKYFQDAIVYASKSREYNADKVNDATSKLLDLVAQTGIDKSQIIALLAKQKSLIIIDTTEKMLNDKHALILHEILSTPNCAVQVIDVLRIVSRSASTFIESNKEKYSSVTALSFFELYRSCDATGMSTEMIRRNICIDRNFDLTRFKNDPEYKCFLIGKYNLLVRELVTKCEILNYTNVDAQKHLRIITSLAHTIAYQDAARKDTNPDLVVEYANSKLLAMSAQAAGSSASQMRI